MTQLTTHTVAHRLKTVALLAGAFALAGCESNSSVAPDSNTSLRIASPAQPGLSTETAEGLSIAGSNGTLVLTNIQLIVDEFELENDDDDCDDDDDRDDDRNNRDCAEFELELFLANVPLGSGAAMIANDRIPAGTYTTLDFEVENLDDDEGGEDGRRIAELLAELRSTYADWPSEASMMIEGTFTPTDGEAQPFRAYFDAEVEIEKKFATPLVIDDNSAGITLELRPDLWFRNANGTVRNLALSDYASTQTLIEFEVELDRGIKLEFDD